MRTSRCSFRPAASAVLLFVGVLAVLLGWRTGGGQGPREAAQAYLRAVAGLDLPAARSLVVGEAAARLDRLGGGRGLVPSAIRAQALSVRREGDWARAFGRVETVSTDGTFGLQWIELQMVRMDAGWRVYRMRPAAPGPIDARERGPLTAVPAGSRGGAGSIPAAARSTLEAFLRAAVRDPDALRPYLEGPALQAWQAQRPLLGPDRLYTAIEGARWAAVSLGRELIRVRGAYQVDGREAQALFTLAPLNGGWRIVEVASLGAG